MNKSINILLQKYYMNYTIYKYFVQKIIEVCVEIIHFGEEAGVVEGASDLFGELYGDRGRHSRSAPGMGALPGGIAVIVDCVIEVARE